MIPIIHRVTEKINIHLHFGIEIDIRSDGQNLFQDTSKNTPKI